MTAVAIRLGPGAAPRARRRRRGRRRGRAAPGRVRAPRARAVAAGGAGAGAARSAVACWYAGWRPLRAGAPVAACRRGARRRRPADRPAEGAGGRPRARRRRCSGGWRLALDAALAECRRPIPSSPPGSRRCGQGAVGGARRARARADAGRRRRARRLRGVAARRRRTGRARERALLAARARVPALRRARRAAGVASRVLHAIRAGDARLAAQRARALGALGRHVRERDPVGHGSGGRHAGVIEVGPNFIARPYRGVSVQEADALDEAALRRWLVGRRVYRRTEFIVAGARRRARARPGRARRRRRRAARASPRDPGARRAARRRVRGRPDGRHRQREPDGARGARLRPSRARVRRPGQLRARELHRRAGAATRTGPWRSSRPSRRSCWRWRRPCSTTTRICRPSSSSFDPIDLRELAAAHPAQHYLFPCRCSGLDAGARVDFLDAGPPEAADWTLVGCERSRQIHVELYGGEPHDGSTSARGSSPPAGARR